MSRLALTPFVPAEAGTQFCPKPVVGQNWIPASAGMNGVGAGELPAALAMVPRGSYITGA
jgi:hypothetical protein